MMVGRSNSPRAGRHARWALARSAKTLTAQDDE